MEAVVPVDVRVDQPHEGLVHQRGRLQRVIGALAAHRPLRQTLELVVDQWNQSVRRKLAVIRRNLDDLATVEGLDLAEYQADRFRLKGAERLLQATVEAAVDANLHLLRAAERATPGDYFTSFVELGRAGIVPEELTTRLAPSAGLRNRLVHEYDQIEDEIVLAAIAEARSDYAEYIAALERYLSGQGL